jgi:hypothetical protein
MAKAPSSPSEKSGTYIHLTVKAKCFGVWQSRPGFAEATRELSESTLMGTHDGLDCPVDGLDYEIRDSKRRASSATVSPLRTLEHEHITSSESGNGGQRMCQFLCQFDCYFDEPWRTSANTGTELNRSPSTGARVSLMFPEATRRTKRPLLYH